jgi:hypothetical protein
MFGIKQRLSKFSPFSRPVKRVLRTLSATLKFPAPDRGEPYVVVVDGMLGYEPLSLYYCFLLSALARELNRPVQVVMLLQKPMHRFWRSNRLISDVFATSYVAFNSRDHISSARRTSQQLAGTLTNQESILDIKLDGLHFGPNIYAGYLRKHFVGSMHPDGPAVEAFLTEACSNIELADAVMTKYHPDLLLLSHSDYHSFGAFFKKFLQAGIPSVIAPLYGEGRAGGRLYSNLSDFEDDARNYVFSCTDRTWNEAVAGYGEIEDTQVSAYLKKRFAGDDNSFNGDYHKSTRRLQKDGLWQALGVRRTFARSALIAAHLLWDDATSSYRNLYVDYSAWLTKTLEVAKKNDQVLWIVKAHPSELHMGTKDRVVDIVQGVFGSELPDHVVFLDADTPFNTYSIIEAVDAVVTVRGTIGFESACCGHSVINAGSGPYTGQGFNREFDTPEAYEDFLLQLHEQNLSLSPQQVRQARIAIFVYLMNKGPVSPLLTQVDSIAALGLASAIDPAMDPVMARFARLIRKGQACDLL